MDPTSNLFSMTPSLIFDPWHAPHQMSHSQHSQSAFFHHFILSWNSRHLQILLPSSVPSLSLCVVFHPSLALLSLKWSGSTLSGKRPLTAPLPFMGQVSLRTCSLDPLHILTINVYYTVLQSPAHSPLSPSPMIGHELVGKLSVIIVMVPGTQYT